MRRNHEFAGRQPKPIAQALQAITDKAETPAGTAAGVDDRAGIDWQDRDQCARMRAQRRPPTMHKDAPQ